MKKNAIQITAAAIISAFGLNAHAGIINGQFLGGANGLTGWQTLGDVSVQNHLNSLGLDLTAPRAMILTTASLGQDDAGLASGAYNLSGSSAVNIAEAGGVADFAHIDAGSLELDPQDHTVSLIEGSAARQMVSVQAGDTLKFQWNLLSRDRDMPDTGWLIISEVGGNAQVFTLAQANAATLASNQDPDLYQTGWQSFSYTFSQSTTASLTWAVADMNDWGQTSMLAIQSVQTLPAVPEPASFSMALIALATFTWRYRKRDSK